MSLPAAISHSATGDALRMLGIDPDGAGITSVTIDYAKGGNVTIKTVQVDEGGVTRSKTTLPLVDAPKRRRLGFPPGPLSDATFAELNAVTGTSCAVLHQGDCPDGD